MTPNSLCNFSMSRVRIACLAIGAMAGAGAGNANELPSIHVPATVSRHLASLVGRPEASRVMHVAIALPMRHQAELERLLGALYDPASPQFRHFLSVPEFTERFGPTSEDYERTLHYFAERGLTVTATSANRHLIDAVARVDTLERVLNVRFGLYRNAAGDRSFIAPDREPTLDLDVELLHIGGLDDETPPTPRFVKRAADGAPPSARMHGSAPDGSYLGSDIRAAYYGSGALTGAGQSVGVCQFAPYSPAGYSTYFWKFGPPLTTTVEPISADGTTAPLCERKVCNDIEQSLDIEYAIAMAPGLSKVQVYVSDSSASMLNRMASDNSSAQISCSWGWAGTSKSVEDPIFQEMAAQGQSFLTASGDTHSLALEPWPEESANLTSVGGTDLFTTAAGGPWAREMAWVDSGGGPANGKAIPIPSYQVPFINASNKGSTTLRNVPDVAGDADAVNYLCASGGCFGQTAGTSFAAPIWGGFIALANEQAANEGKGRIGFLNPLLYAIAGNAGTYASAFHDITVHRSGKDAAVVGYDLLTGLGSPNGQGMIDALVNPPR